MTVARGDAKETECDVVAEDDSAFLVGDSLLSFRFASVLLGDLGDDNDITPAGLSCSFLANLSISLAAAAAAAAAAVAAGDGSEACKAGGASGLGGVNS